MNNESITVTEVQNIARNIAAQITAPTVQHAVSRSLDSDATCYDQVHAFHVLYDAPIETRAYEGITNMTDDRIKLRIGLIEEEFNELKEAAANRDVVEVADALGDIIYVVCGFAIEAGIDLEAAVAEIHASNMTKLDSDGSVIRREDGKILKGPNYRKPDIRAVIRPIPQAKQAEQVG